jgi:hypothetical protein
LLQIFVPEETTIEGDEAMVEEVTAEQSLVHPHQRATSKSRREGFEPTEEEVKELSVLSSQTISGRSDAHKENRYIASKKENQTGVIDFLIFLDLLFYYIFWCKKSFITYCFQIYISREEAAENPVFSVEETKAERSLILPHIRATSKPRQIGFEPNEEEAGELQTHSIEPKTGDSKIHRESRSKVNKNETQAAVSNCFTSKYNLQPFFFEL